MNRADARRANYDLDLSAQVLRTCQQLHEEGQQILYKENTLCINYKGDQHLRHRSRNTADLVDYCHILDQRVHLPGLLSDLPSTDFSLRSYATKQSQPRVRVDLDMEGRWDYRQFDNTSLQAYPAMAKFQHIRLELYKPNQERLHIACRVLRDLLFNKDVDLVFVSDIADDHEVEDPSLLQPCKFLRCNAFRIGRPAGVDSTYAAAISDVECLVLGGTPVDDTYAQLVEIKEKVIRGLPDMDDTAAGTFESFGSVDRAFDSIWDLCEAGEQYDSSSFQQHKSEVLEVAEEYSKDWEAWQIAKTEEERREQQQAIRDLAGKKLVRIRESREEDGSVEDDEQQQMFHKQW